MFVQVRQEEVILAPIADLGLGRTASFQPSNSSHSEAPTPDQSPARRLSPQSVFILASMPSSAAAFTDAESAHIQLKVLSDTVLSDHYTTSDTWNGIHEAVFVAPGILARH